MDLSDIRVLDLTQLLPGPYATQLLADMGADVIKIERPDGGDPARRLAADPSPELAGVFEAGNCGKRSVALDLTDERAREAFYKLAADTDAVIEGFRPGVVDRLGVDYEILSVRTDGLVYCSLTGHGQSGPTPIGRDTILPTRRPASWTRHPRRPTPRRFSPRSRSGASPAVRWRRWRW